MRSLNKIFLFYFFVFASLIFNLKGQTYPVQISTQLVPPYSGYLPDYADPTAEKLKIILKFNDFSQTQYNVKLRFIIQGNGFTISTKTFFNPPPITILPGQPLLLSGNDLAPYLNTNNLDFIGINQSQYQQRMALPEGYYSICVTAYDYYNSTPIQISNQACAQAWFTLSDPPFLNLPLCNTTLSPLTPQNILFQWTPINLGSPLSALSTEYEFALYECRPDSTANPNQIVLSTAPIYSITTQQTFINYGIAEPPLNLYMKYVWRVRAKDNTGRDLFKNQGYSQICTFKYGSVNNVLGNTIALTITAEGISHRTGLCNFTKQSVFSNYTLQVRKQGANNWFNYPNTTGTERIPNLEPQTTYECRVRGEQPIIGNWSNIANFTTLSAPVYGCNNNTQPYNTTLPEPLPISKAVIGLVIQSGQFEVFTTKIQAKGTPGWYSGNGYALVFGGLPVAVKWDNIYIDSENRQQQGVIEAMTKGVDAWLSENDLEQAEENATYVEGEIDSVYMSGNQICYTFQGNATPICIPTPSNVNVVVIRDSEGNQYALTLQPPPPKITGPSNYLIISEDVLSANDNLKVVFKASTNQNFGFDEKQYAAFIDNYETIKLSNGKNYFVPNKSIGESYTDEALASFTITNFSANQLSFKTQSGSVLNSISQGNNQYKITGIPANSKCVYAWYNGQKIGKLNVLSYKAISKKLIIVPVNNANISLTATSLNAIYKQANITWSVSTSSNFNFNLGNDGLEAADATLLSKYSAEMRALRDAYKTANANYDKDAYYIFVVPSFSDQQLQGYMVRGRALGFVKANSTAKEITHELAHGAFGLEHTFPQIPQNGSNNLLDYNTGITLVKEQWESITNDNFVASWFDDEENASLYGSSLGNNLTTLFNLTTGDNCLDRSVTRGLEAITKYQFPLSINIAGYTSAVEYVICITEEDKLSPTANYATKFSYGFINEIAGTIDIDAMADGITDLTIQYLKLKIKCLLDKKNITISLPCTNCADKNAINEDIKCFTGISPQEAGDLITAAETYAKANYDNPYIHGKVTAFIVSAAIPVLGEVKFANLTKALSKIKDSKLIQKFTTLSNRIKNKSIKQIIDELKLMQGAGKWIDDLDIFLGAGTKIKINSWISKGLSESKLEAAFAKTSDKTGLLNKLETSKSIYHQRVHIEDWDNIPGIMKSNYTSNGLSIGKTNIAWNNSALDLPALEAANFVNATAVELPAGTKIYRVTGGNPAGGYWTIQKPNSVGDVIGGTSVQPAWNDFSKMYVYEVPQGQTLKVWQGTTAKQPIGQGVTNPHLPGGAQQLFIPDIVRDNTFKNLVQQTPLPW